MLETLYYVPDYAVRGYDKDYNPAEILFKRNSFLKDLKVQTENGTPEPIGNYINAWAASLDINQRLIVVTLQREQGLLNYTDRSQLKPYYKWLIVNPFGVQRAVNTDGQDDTPALAPGETIKDRVTMDLVDWGCGYGVPDDGVNFKYKGIEAQIRGACYCYRKWYDYYKPDQEKEMVGEPNAIAGNAGTCALLWYTPHRYSGIHTAEIFREFYGVDYLNGPA